MNDEEIIKLIKDKKMSFVDVLYMLYTIDMTNKLEKSISPTWFKPEQLAWIRKAFELINKSEK